MAVPHDRLQELIERKDVERAAEWCSEHRYVEGWRILRADPSDVDAPDVAMVVYDVDDPPAWLLAIIRHEQTAETLAEDHEIAARAIAERAAT